MLPQIKQLIDQASLARREHRLTDALSDLTEAVAICRRTGVRNELILSLKALGQIERDLGRNQIAHQMYEEAVALAREEGEPLTLAHTIRHLGDIHRDAKRLTQAEVCYLEALSLYRGHMDTKKLDLANAIRPLAILKEATGNFQEATRLWREAKELYEAADIAQAVAECTSRIAGLTTQSDV
ncbi:MAG TPA: tetratricopeptide repeat protein [Gemmata sp.]|jgi:tetratricopeptide (TPR) repeat protein|nr:tetratricopeptide repeat protein [Gemmata sp.]